MVAKKIRRHTMLKWFFLKFNPFRRRRVARSPQDFVLGAERDTGKGVFSLASLWPRTKPRRRGPVVHRKVHPHPTKVLLARRRAKGQHPRTGRKLAA